MLSCLPWLSRNLKPELGGNSSRMHGGGAKSRWPTRRTQNSHLLMTMSPTRHRWGTMDKGMGGTPSDWVGCGAWREWRGGEVEVGKDWYPWGEAEGRERIPHPKGELREPLGGQRIKRECGQVSPAHLDPQEPVEIPGLTLCPPRSLQLHGSWGGAREGRGSKSKSQTSRTGTPEGGWLREGRSSYSQWDTPTVRGPMATGETLGEMVGEWWGGT